MRQNALTSRIGKRVRDTEGLSYNLFSRFGYGPSYLDGYLGRLRKVTLDQVNEAIRKHLHPNKLHAVVAGDVVKLPE